MLWYALLWRRSIYMQSGDNEKTDTEVREILDYYKGLPERGSQEVIVSMLRELQDVCGWIGPSVLEEAAQTAGVKESLIEIIMKRYPSLKKSPYVHEIIVCTGQNCASRDNLKLLQELRQRLKIGGDGISQDGRIYMKTRACLKQCRTTPNIMVDGKIYSGKSVKEIVSMVTGHGTHI